MLQFHPQNLANRQRCEQAYVNFMGVDLTTMNTVAEILCHTETIPEDLLYSDRSRRMLTLLQGRYIEISNGRVVHLSSQIRPEMRFRLTEKGREALRSAAAKPYAAVGETISSTLHEDRGVMPEHHQAFQQILDAETADRRVQQQSSHQGRSSRSPSSSTAQERHRLEQLLSQDP